MAAEPVRLPNGVWGQSRMQIGVLGVKTMIQQYYEAKLSGYVPL